MRRRKRLTKSTRASSNETPDDYSVYLPIDRIKPTDLPFRIADYREEGIFSDDEQNALGARHGLTADMTNELSILVGNALDSESYVSFVRVSRSKVQKRLDDALNGKRVRTTPLLDDIGMINQVLAALSLPHFVPFAGDHSGKIHMAGAPEDIWGTGGRNLGSPEPHTPIALNCARKVLVPDDRRTEADERRRAVVEQCCYIALDAGWTLSFTTDPGLDKSQRTGRLVNLIRDVVRLATDPQINLSGDTIVNDIEVARRRIEENDEYDGDIVSD